MGIFDDNVCGDLSDEMVDLCVNLFINVVVEIDRVLIDLVLDVVFVKCRCNGWNIIS